MADQVAVTETIINDLPIPQRLLNDEVEQGYMGDILDEMREIKKFYNVYENGAEFTAEGTRGNYTAADLKQKLCRTIVDKEARFFASKTPKITIVPPGGDESEKANAAMEQDLINNVLKDNHFSRKILQAAKDCFIGKRVLAILNFNQNGVSLSFVPSMQFLFETEPTNVDVLTKVVAFFIVRKSKNNANRRIYKKKYEMKNGFCHVSEGIYDGGGNEIKVLLTDVKTKFKYIPAVIISNGGLSGDIQGESEISQLQEYESWYSKMNGADLDAERKSMNPIIWALDMNPSTTKNLSSSAGSFWDLKSNDNGAEGRTGAVGMLEPSMSYTGALNVTLDRIKRGMYNQVDMPDIDSLEGKVTSGKALKAIYWGLIVRCDEKFLAWGSALEFLTRTIMKGVSLYPEAAKPHYEEYKPTNGDYEIDVENQYPLLSDETEEKTVDLAEVTNKVMSKKAYMKKWYNMTDTEADAELDQIAEEREHLEDSFNLPSGFPPEGQGDGQATQEDEPEGAGNGTGGEQEKDSKE